MRIARRPVLALLGSSALAGVIPPARAADKFVTVGIALPLTGAAAEDATNILHGAQLAIEEANAKGGIAGYEIRTLVLDNGTATAGQYDPAQAANNARKMVTDPAVVAAVGPMSSGSGKAMAPLLSQGNLATVTPSSTNPDLTDPKFAGIYRPAGKAIYFRTCTTDAFQGPNMANFMADRLKVKSVFVVDDTGAYGVGLADAFQAQAAKRGIQVMGRDQIDPLNSDYRPLLSKIKQLGPQALYAGSSALAGVKLVKQSYEIIPDVIKAGGDGLHQASILAGAGFPAVQGWYSTIAAPHMLDDAKVSGWLANYQKRWELAAGRLLDHCLRCRACDHCRDRNRGEVRRAGDPRRGARCHPVRQGGHLAGADHIRRQRRYQLARSQRVPGAAGQGASTQRRVAPVQIYRCRAGG